MVTFFSHRNSLEKAVSSHREPGVQATHPEVRVTSTVGPKIQARSLVIGSTGLVGSNLVDYLLSEDTHVVYGVSRSPSEVRCNLRSISVDLTDSSVTSRELRDIAPDFAFLCAWSMGQSEAENIRINGAIVRNVLSALRSKPSLKHVALVTGTKHYLGPFELYAKGTPETPFREDQDRLSAPNFYYEQEDSLIAAAKQNGFSYSVHRPYTIVGHSIGKAMNIGATIAAYASICRETGLEFEFPGSAVAWSGLSEYSDARLIAKHMLWAATTSSAHNQAFNVVNGDLFRWSWMWPRIAEYFGIKAAPYRGTPTSLATRLSNAGPAWDSIIARHHLQNVALSKLASPWHTDLDLSRTFEILSDMTKSRDRGFVGFQNSERSFLDLFDRMRQEKLIPSYR
jgi:nucleoside-diphosphate-sugar epimerase